jgi:hypothetical protein
MLHTKEIFDDVNRFVRHSSWLLTPGGTVTQRAHAAAVSATGNLKPASFAVADTSINTPTRIASARL